MLQADRTTLAYQCPLPSPSLPRRIADARARALDCIELGLGARWLLAELLRALDASDATAAIRVGNDFLAGRLGKSVETVGRLKRELEQLGWITRHQPKTRDRPFSVSLVWLTRKAIEVLHLAEPPRARRPSSMAAASQTPPQFEKTQQAAPGPLKDPQAHSGPAAGEGMVPPDLVQLVELGMRPSGVYALMALARRQKVRLGHVVAALKAKLTDLRAPSLLFRYLQVVLQRTSAAIDWSARAEAAQRGELAKREEEGAKRQAELDRAAVDAMVRGMSAEAFYGHAKGEFVWRLMAGHVYRATTADLASRGRSLGTHWGLEPNPVALSRAWADGRITLIDSSK